MKIFIISLILLLNIQSWTKADDIREFEIEGMSLGDSALDYFSKEEMKLFFPIDYPASEKFAGFEVPVNNFATKSFKTYDTVGFHFKKNDKNLKFVSLKGIIEYPNNINDCLKQKNKVVREIRIILNNSKEKNYEGNYGSESKSVAYISDFIQQDGYIRVWCSDWDKKTETDKGFVDDLSVAVESADFINWINDEAYN